MCWTFGLSAMIGDVLRAPLLQPFFYSGGRKWLQIVQMDPLDDDRNFADRVLNHANDDL